MTAEQAAENIKAKIEDLASKAAARMDALDIGDHDWLDPRVRHPRRQARRAPRAPR